MKTLLLLVFVLFAAPAIAADVGQPPPDAKAKLDQARAAVSQAMAAIQAAADAHQAEADLAASQPSTAPIVIPAPQVTVLPPAALVSIPAQVRDALVSAGALLIPGMVGIGLAWMRSHLKFMRNVGMNQQITASAEGFGALLVQDLKQQGLPATINIRNSQVAAFTQRVIDGYPEYVAATGITPDKVATLILKGAAKVLPPTDPQAPSPLIPQGV